ncbi:hypothetical protein CYMTET_43556 [Cymbomonas tetramitiformis]|uniref:Uncharacterized protein n=1 Tax=Cymbomonas tetramitiformis TaxID=36881 RepID=A0AAE0C407_9CHLO|nr:hypothetical protein CYMTET_43556 [Cymbomonas tetramitiformis]
MNNKQTTLDKSLSVEADRVDLDTLLQEAVEALENGMRELLIAPVETIIHHHKKNSEGKFEGEMDPVGAPVGGSMAAAPIPSELLQQPPQPQTQQQEQEQQQQLLLQFQASSAPPHGNEEMYYGANQHLPPAEPTVTLSLREAQFLGQALMNPAQQARGGRGGRNMNLEEYLFFMNQNR